MLKSRYDVQQNMRVGKYEYDIIAISKTRSTTDLLYEIKYLNKYNSKILLRTFTRMKDAAINYETITNRFALYKLFIVCKSENLDLLKKKFSQDLDSIDESMLIHVEIEFVSEDELVI